MIDSAERGRSVDIVVTTIFDPAWLPGYLENISAFGHTEDVTLRIICDRKTPRTVYDAAERARNDGLDIDCPSLDEQETYVRRLGLPDDYVPWNTDNRRNIGFLRAWENGADVLISIDDDNYCRQDSDFIESHCVVGSSCADLKATTKLATGAPWFNICSLLETDTTEPIYPRGHPYEARSPAEEATLRAISDEVGASTVAVNAGLWLLDPDVDAITRLALKPHAECAKPDAVVLGPDTWAPINTQNTALLRSALPAYYYVRMGHPLQGMRIDRFGDILSGYLVQKCAKRLGHVVRFGSPIADHRRTPHNLLQDLYHELAGIVLIEEVLPWLQELDVSGADFATVYIALADALEQQAPHFSGFVWDEGGRDFIGETAGRMRTWVAALNRIEGASR